MTSPTRIAVYVATTPTHLAEAELSAASLRAHMPELPIMLFSQLQVSPGLFDSVEMIGKRLGASADKIRSLLSIRHEQILFIDTDTFVCGSLEPGFDLLERFEIAAAVAPIKATYDVPPGNEAFPEFNTGVLFLRNTPRLHAFLQRWLELYTQLRDRDASRVYDQPAFRQALYESDLSLHTLPPEYNYRFIFPGFASGPVRVLHGRAPDLPDLAALINRDQGKRVHTYHGNRLRVFTETEMPPSRWIRIGRLLGLCE